MFDASIGTFAANKVMRELGESGRIGSIETKKTTVFPETVLTFRDMGGKNACMSQFAEEWPVVGGDILTVIFDGTKYETTVIAHPQEGGGYLAGFGNLSITGMGDDTGEPFMGMYTHQPSASNFMLTIMSADSETSHTVAIYKATESIHPIDPKYLPGGGVTLPVVQFNAVISLDGVVAFDEEDSAKMEGLMTNGCKCFLGMVPVSDGIPCPILFGFIEAMQGFLGLFVNYGLGIAKGEVEDGVVGWSMSAFSIPVS